MADIVEELEAGPADGRTLSGEVYLGMPVAAWMAEGEHCPTFATHWSTLPEHSNPRRLFSEDDVSARLRAAEVRAEEVERAATAAQEALDWYEKNARLCRLVHSGGDAGRHALSEDGGKRAWSASAAIRSLKEPRQ